MNIFVAAIFGVFSAQAEDPGAGWAPSPIDALDTVDERKAAYGLPPLAQYRHEMTAYRPG